MALDVWQHMEADDFGDLIGRSMTGEEIRVVGDSQEGFPYVVIVKDSIGLTDKEADELEALVMDFLKGKGDVVDPVEASTAV
jgi:hypothetical protein